MKTITIAVQLNESSQPIIHKDVINTYTKGPLYCIYTKDEKTFKYPVASIWRVVEGYGYHGREPQA